MGRSFAVTVPAQALLVLATLLWAGPAGAYCRATTCRPALESCRADEDECIISGIPLQWYGGCVTFAVDQEGSPRRNISYEQAHHATSEAFRAWVLARCDQQGEHPSLGALSLGWVDCDAPEYNDKPPQPNANAIVFREDDWPYGGDSATLALTTLTFDLSSGNILDADIEVNSYQVSLTTERTNVNSDLQSILTHEIGHLLGLAHSADPEATMNASYNESDIALRTLSRDDELGICAIYPPGGDLDRCRGVQPRFGFSHYCGEPYQEPGCALTSEPGRFAGGTQNRALWLGSALLGLSLLRRLRRRAAAL